MVRVPFVATFFCSLIAFSLTWGHLLAYFYSKWPQRYHFRPLRYFDGHPLYSLTSSLCWKKIMFPSDFSVQYRPSQCVHALPEEYNVICKSETGGLFILPHHKPVCKIQLDCIVGINCSNDQLNCHFIIFCLLLVHR